MSNNLNLDNCIEVVKWATKGRGKYTASEIKWLAGIMANGEKYTREQRIELLSSFMKMRMDEN